MCGYKGNCVAVLSFFAFVLPVWRFRPCCLALRLPRRSCYLVVFGSSFYVLGMFDVVWCCAVGALWTLTITQKRKIEEPEK